jgi:hypothetical protein
MLAETSGGDTMTATNPDWPALPLSAWEPTYLTLQRWTQVIGKVRMARAPALNHWWHAPLYVTSTGLTTGTFPAGPCHLSLTFDLCEHRFVAHASDHRRDSFALEPMSVADFHARAMALLARLDCPTSIWPVPVEVVDRTPFADDRHHAAYDRVQVEALHRILMSADRVFSTHRGRFVGKSSPVHFFWGAFDLAVSRFSGRPNPAPPADAVMGEAYSHEVISHGFWPGGDWPVGGRLEEAAFYAYAVPEPAGFRTAAVRPAAARFDEVFGEYLLPYEAVRRSADPDAMLLDFMESTYLAAARPAGWDVDVLRHRGAAGY